MSNPRAPMASEIPNVLGFLNQNLRPHQNWSIAAEYPAVFEERNLDNIRILTEGDQVLAHAAIKYLHIKNVMGIFKVAAIGSVVTDPKVRNQGHSKKILESCIAAAEKENADFAILWTDLFDFYRKLDFELAGTEVSLVLEDHDSHINPTGHNVAASDSQSLRFLHTNKVSPEALLRLYSRHVCSSLRTTEDIAKSLNIPNANVFTAWSPSNELMAYAVEGKGLDLKGYIHEWGGGVSSLLPLLDFIQSTIGGPITMIVPSFATNLIEQLKGRGALVNLGHLGMIRPLCFTNLFFKVKRYARQNGVEDLILEPTENGFIIGTPGDTVTIPDTRTLTRLLFGPLDKEILKPKFQSILPIPMWVWGWDSV